MKNLSERFQAIEDGRQRNRMEFLNQMDVHAQRMIGALEKDYYFRKQKEWQERAIMQAHHNPEDKTKWDDKGRPFLYRPNPNNLTDPWTRQYLIKGDTKNEYGFYDMYEDVDGHRGKLIDYSMIANYRNWRSETDESASIPIWYQGDTARAMTHFGQAFDVARNRDNDDYKGNNPDGFWIENGMVRGRNGKLYPIGNLARSMPTATGGGGGGSSSSRSSGSSRSDDGSNKLEWNIDTGSWEGFFFAGRGRDGVNRAVDVVDIEGDDEWQNIVLKGTDTIVGMRNKETGRVISNMMLDHPSKNNYWKDDYDDYDDTGFPQLNLQNVFREGTLPLDMIKSADDVYMYRTQVGSGKNKETIQVLLPKFSGVNGRQLSREDAIGLFNRMGGIDGNGEYFVAFDDKSSLTHWRGGKHSKQGVKDITAHNQNIDEIINNFIAERSRLETRQRGFTIPEQPKPIDINIADIGGKLGMRRADIEQLLSRDFVSTDAKKFGDYLTITRRADPSGVGYTNRPQKWVVEFKDPSIIPVGMRSGLGRGREYISVYDTKEEAQAGFDLLKRYFDNNREIETWNRLYGRENAIGRTDRELQNNRHRIEGIN
jgi:hypothetical protein